jgi:hypothetical protein
MAGWYDKPEVRSECLKVGKKESDLLRKVLTYKNDQEGTSLSEGLTPLKSA